MITTILFSPEGAESSPKAKVLEWHVNEGDLLAAGDTLLSYEIDKAVVAFRVTATGFLRRRLLAEGDRFGPGSLLALLSDRADEDLPPVPTPTHQEEEDASVFDWSEIDERGGDPEPLGVMRRTIAERMAMSKRSIPCFYLTTAIDMSGCLDLRASLKKNGQKATFNDMVIKAAAIALTIHPKVAGVYVPEGFLPRRRMNIGFAAALPDDGLVVPVIKDADKKSLVAIASETRDLAAKAKRGELTPADCSGGIFSVSYLGSYEVDAFIAIVNPGEAAILAASKITDKPVVADSQMVIRPIMKITLSYDHRSIDGALGARFAGELKKILENPGRLLETAL